MFSKDNRYTTRGVIQEVNSKNPLTYLMLWGLIDEMNVPDEEKDYLQIFKLRVRGKNKDIQEIEHIQEEPEYKSFHRFYTNCPVEATIYVIDDGDHCTMLLSNEY